MSRYDSTDDHEPLLWVQGHAFYATHVIVAFFAFSMVATALLSGLQVAGPFVWLPFDSERVLRGEFWRVLTYGWINPPSLPGVINLAMLGVFGREVEKFFGRRGFLKLFACVYLLPPVLFTLIGLWSPREFAGEQVTFPIFIAFATLYPGAVLFFNVLAKWVAIILVALYTLIAISNRDLIGFINLAATTGFAWLFVRHAQGTFSLPSLRLPRAKRGTSREAPSPRASRPAAANEPGGDFMAKTDALLDKIARNGIGSLTAAERKHLDEARERLKQRRSG